jgi:hypothetical protein
VKIPGTGISKFFTAEFDTFLVFFILLEIHFYFHFTHVSVLFFFFGKIDQKNNCRFGEIMASANMSFWGIRSNLKYHFGESELTDRKCLSKFHFEEIFIFGRFLGIRIDLKCLSKCHFGESEAT